MPGAGDRRERRYGKWRSRRVTSTADTAAGWTELVLTYTAKRAKFSPRRENPGLITCDLSKKFDKRRAKFSPPPASGSPIWRKGENPPPLSEWHPHSQKRVVKLGSESPKWK